MAQTISQNLTTGNCSNPMFLQLTQVTRFPNSLLYTNSTTCGGLWKKAGACCDYISLVNYQRSDKLYLLGATANLSTNLENITVALTTIIEKVKNASNSSSTGPTNSNVPRLQGAQLCDDMSTNLTKLTGIKEKLQTCQYFMEKSRSSALCSICSGIGQKFFVNEKAGISPAQCGLMVNACSVFLMDILAFVDDVESFLAKSLQPELGILGSWFTSRTSINDELAKTNRRIQNFRVQKTKIHDAFSEYNAKKDLASLLKFQSEICNSFYDLLKNSFLEEVKKTTADLTAMYNIIRREALTGDKAITNSPPTGSANKGTSGSPKSQLPRTLRSCTNWRHLSSADDLANNSSNVFEADSSVLLNSTDKTVNDMMSMASGTVAPMNLSLLFP